VGIATSVNADVQAGAFFIEKGKSQMSLKPPTTRP